MILFDCYVFKFLKNVVFRSLANYLLQEIHIVIVNAYKHAAVGLTEAEATGSNTEEATKDVKLTQRVAIQLLFDMRVFSLLAVWKATNEQVSYIYGHRCFGWELLFHLVFM